jgi:outer membrane murein-binding lipoprotein Lpp
MKKLMMIAVVISVSALAGCMSPAERMAKNMAECEAQGISKDTCYQVEKDNQSRMNAMYQKQSMENARDAAAGEGVFKKK